MNNIKEFVTDYCIKAVVRKSLYEKYQNHVVDFELKTPLRSEEMYVVLEPYGERIELKDLAFIARDKIWSNNKWKLEFDYGFEEKIPQKKVPRNKKDKKDPNDKTVQTNIAEYVINTGFINK